MSLLKWIAVLVSVSSCVTTADDTSKNSKLVKSTNCFSVSLTPKLKSKEPKDGNLICSALSADIVLSMLQMGAKGSTFDELNQALQYQSNSLSKDDIQNKTQEQLLSLYGIKDLTLNIANSMWMDKQFVVKSSYQEVVRQKFLATVDTLDFKNNAHDATNSINQWVDNKTNSLIPKLLTSDLEASTVLVIVNALYFKGIWKHPFDASRTKKAPFRNNDRESEIKIVSLMNQIEDFRYKDDENLQAEILEMEYKGSVASLIVVLPKGGVTLSDVEAKLDCTNIGDLLNHSTLKKVNVTLPTFDITSDLDLKQPLRDLNVNSIFDSPDLSLIADGNIAVTKIVQKARIKVYEKGSEAAAATGAVIMLKSIRPRPVQIVQFNANRPFSYYIVHKSSGQILFSGRLTQL